MTALILGATGFVGRALLPALVAADGRVRAVSRRGGQESHSGVDWVVGDVRAPHTLARAFTGMECVYYLVHSMGEGAHDFRDVERRSAEGVMRVASETGVKRIVYLGGVAPVGTPSEHLASRLEVGSILRAGPVPTLELRAAMIIGNGSASWQIIRDLALRLPFMLLPRWLESKSCPIALGDVVTALIDARAVLLAESAWFDIPGREILSAREMLSLVAEIEGRRVPAVRVPLLTPRLSGAWLKLISRVDYQVARELVVGLREDLLPRDRRYWELTGHQPQCTFREAVADALRTEPPQAGITGWFGRQEERMIRAWLRRGS